MRRRSLALRAAPFLVVACAAPSAPNAVDTADPSTLEWVTPRVAGDPGAGDTTTVRVGEAFDLGVSTQASDATVVHFVVDGAEVGACDAQDTTTDCRQGDEWLWTVASATAGVHALDAWFIRADGTALHARRTLTVLPASEAVVVPTPGASNEPDPVGDDALVLDGTSDFDDAPGATPALDDDIDPDTVAHDPDIAPNTIALQDTGDADDAAAAPTSQGYVDPSRAAHAVFGGLAWSVQGHRVTFAHASLDADLVDVGNCVRLYGTSIDRYADSYHVSRAALVGAAMAATSCDVDSPRAAHGLMGLRASTCAALTASDPQPLAPAACAQHMVDSPDFAIAMATRWLASPALRRLHQSDPPLMAAAFATGTVAPSVANRWHLFAPRDATGLRDYVTAFVAAYNGYRSNEHIAALTRLNLPGDGAPLAPAAGLDTSSSVPLAQLQADAAARYSDADLDSAAAASLADAAAAAASHQGHAMLYHGGPVLNHEIPVYIIWWGARWRVNTGRAATIRRFLGNLNNTGWWLTNSTYSDSAHQRVSPYLYIAGELHYDMVPSHGRWIRIPQSYPGDVVYNAFGHRGLPLDNHAIYLVLTDDRTRMPGFGSDFCGWHTVMNFVSSTYHHIEYAWVGDGAVTPDSCGDRQARLGGLLGHHYVGPHNDPVDATLSVIAHELAETATDPLINAWGADNTGEIGDRCAWNFGPTADVGGGHRANLTLAGENYLIQQLWLNTSPTLGQCAMHP